MKKRLLLTLLVLACISVLTGKRIYEQQLAGLDGSGNRDPEVATDPAFESLIREFEAFIRFRLEKEGFPGAAVVMVKDTNIIYLKTFGLKERFSYDSIDAHTVFRLASLSKGFAPVLTGMLVQEGVLNWDDRVIDHLPDFALRSPEATQSLTLRHVLSHTTGLPRHTFSNLLDAGVPYPDIRRRLPEVRLINEVGTYYNYQNVAYSLIGDVIERATGRSYAELLRERIFQPLNMHDASASYEEMIRCKNVAVPHRYRSDGYRPVDISPRYYSVCPAAGVNASVTDMAQWLRFLLGQRPDLLAPELLREIFRPYVDLGSRDLSNWRPIMERAYYAMGWRVIDSPSSTIIYHGGYVNAYRSEIAFIPEDGFGIAVLTNAPSAFISHCLPFFFEMYFLHKQRKFDPLDPLITLRRQQVSPSYEGEGQNE